MDDEPQILKALLRDLRHEGYKLIAASSAQAGLTALQQQEVHVVLADYRMPEMNGDEFLAHVRDDFPNIRRIMLSGFASLEESGDSIWHGVAEHLVIKPWESSELLGMIRSCLAKLEEKD